MSKTFFHFCAVAAVIALFLSSCASEEFISKTEDPLDRRVPAAAGVRAEQNELDRIAHVLANEGKDIVTVKDAAIVNLTDVLGDFQAISFTYRSDGRVVSMIVPVAEVFNATDSRLEVSPEGCVMKFYGREESDYEITERCKTLVAYGAGNSTSVSFW